MPSNRPATTRRARALLPAVATALALAALGVSAAVLATEPAGAASQGAGFGTWAPISTYGWHGSMRVGDVHTYCITPGAPAPTGPTEEHGISGDVAGLSPATLTGINLLVSKYGQTEDPVQAASVGWAVKMLANPHETLHAFGYPGDDLRGAIHWTFSALAPEHDRAVQELASAYFAEGSQVDSGPRDGHGRVVITTTADDALAGTVRVEAEPADARGSLRLENAVFADSGAPTRDDVVPGHEYAIRALPGDAAEVRVSATGRLHGGYRAAVRHFTTPGGQETAGPAAPLDVPIEGADDVPRRVTFAPTITTQTASAYAAGGRFTDDVTFRLASGAWPRDEAGHAVVRARGVVYRTDEPAAAESASPPSTATAVATLDLATDPRTGPTVPYRVTTEDPLPGPGVYTMVWTILAAEQSDEVAARLPADYAWREPFGERTQTTIVPDIRSRAEESATVGAPVSDTVVVGAPLPRGGLDVSAALFRARDGVPPAEACTDDALVWDGADHPTRVTTPGEVVVTAPALPDFGTYYWRELAVDTDGRVVHRGACGVPSETTRAAPPTVTTTAPPQASFGGAVRDTARVAGHVPASGTTTLAFALYRAAPDGAPRCADADLVAETSAQPVVVTGPGDHPSPAVVVESSGVHHWVESLWWQPDSRSAPRLLARGACGAATETTTVATPALETRADPRVAAGEAFRDTATVTGLDASANAEVMFFVYRSRNDAAPVCDATTLESTTAPVAIRGSGSFASPAVTASDAGTRHWIAQLQYTRADGSNVVLARGTCGEEHESTIVGDLPATGPLAGAGTPLAAGGGALLAGIGAALVWRARRSSMRRARRIGRMAR